MNGACSYTFVDGATCDDGNACTVADTCSGGACTGTPMVCNAPPAPVCVSSTTLLTYDATGACNAGICVYTQHQITCSGGPCMNDACQTDPCTGVTCNTPPSSCYGAAGTCSGGSCSYPYANGATCNDNNPCTVNDTCNAGACSGAPMSCNTPPASSCSDAQTLEVYAQSGTCSGGTCGYTPSFVSCAAGCANGLCNGGGWTTMTSSTNNDLVSVWGSSATAVWAVGYNGTAVFYNGVQWQVQSPPIASTAVIWSVAGTAAGNVFAVGSDNTVYKFDGTSWSVHTTIPSTNRPGLFVDGTNSLWIAGNAGSSSYMTLYRSVNGVVTTIGHSTSAAYASAYGAAPWAISPTDVWVPGIFAGNYNGSTVSNQTEGAYGLWGYSSTQVFLGYQPTLFRWNGTGFDTFNTGINGLIFGVSGTATTRVFGAMGMNGSNTGAVFYFDGVGITQQTIPAGTKALYSIWAAPTGEVFAVGSTGTIIKGP